MKQEIVDQLKSLSGNADLHEKELVLQLRRIVEAYDFRNQLEFEAKSLAKLMENKLPQLISNEKNENLISTGFEDLDQKLGGFSLSEMTVFGGRPGMGKTVLMVNLALQLAKKNPVLYFSFDLAADLLLNRFLSCLSKIPIQKLEQQQLDDTQKMDLIKVVETFHSLPIHVVDGMNSSLSLFKAYAQKMVEEKGIKIIIVDYLQLMNTHRFKNNRDLEISMITRELKNIARELKVCVLVSSQISRAVETRGGDKRPYLSDLRESGAIEQDADKVIFVYRPEYYGLIEDENGMPTEGIMELIISKNRTGPLDTSRVGFERETGILRDIKSENIQHFRFNTNRLDELNGSDDAPF